MYYVKKNDELYHVLKDQNELYHHGVKGQKWGVRRTPEQLGHISTKTGIRKDQEGHRKITTVNIISKMKNLASFVGITTIVGGSAVFSEMYPVAAAISLTAFTAATLSISAVRNKRMEKERKKDYIKEDGPIEKLKNLSRLTTSESSEESVKLVNLSHGRYSGGVHNCASCAIAMDMRAKGYDVRARKQHNGLLDAEIAKVYKGGRFKRIEMAEGANSQTKYNNVYDTLSKINHGNSSGIFCMCWMGYVSGHAIYYKSVDGKVEFYDGQIKQSGRKLDKYFVNAEPNGFTYMRTDNKEPRENITSYIVSRDLKDRGN